MFLNSPHFQLEKMMEEKLNIIENCHKLETEVIRLGGEINTVTGISNTYAENLKEDISELKGELGTKLVENTQFAERYNNLRAEVKHLSGVIEIMTQQKNKMADENNQLKENVTKGKLNVSKSNEM